MAKRLFFPNIIFVDNDLNILVNEAKQLLDQYGQVVEKLKVKDILFGINPKCLSFLKEQNNKPYFSSGSRIESNPTNSRSLQEIPTPVSKNRDTLNVPKGHLPLDGVKVNNSATLESSISVKRQTAAASSENQILYFTFAGTSNDANLIYPIVISGRNAESTQTYPRLAQMAKKTSNITMAQKKCGGQERLIRRIDPNSSKCLSSAEESRIASSQTMVEEEIRRSAKAMHNIIKEGHKFNQYAQATRTTSSLALNDEMASASAKNTDCLNPEANSDLSDSINNDFTGHAERIVEIPQRTIIGGEMPIPEKRSKIRSNSGYGLEEFSTPPEILRMDGSSCEDTEIYTPDYKINESTNNSSTEISSDERKRKYVSRIKKSTPIERTPKIKQLSGQAEIDVEVPCNSEYNATPTTSVGSSADFRGDSIKDNTRSPVAGGSKTKTPRRILDWNQSPSETRNSTDNMPAGKLPGGRNASTGKLQSVPSSKSDVNSACIENDLFELEFNSTRFSVLLTLRVDATEKILSTLLTLQRNVHYFGSYNQHLGLTLLGIDVSDKEYVTKELKETVYKACKVTVELGNKLKSWQTNVDSDVNILQQCVQEFGKLKEQYLHYFSIGRAITSEVCRIYELKFKAIWKKIDEIVMKRHSEQESLFSEIGVYFGMLKNEFTRCLFQMGLLQESDTFPS